MAQPEGTSHGEHEIADVHAIAVAQRRGDQIGGGEFHHSHVGIGIFDNLHRMKEPAVGQFDSDAVGRGVADDVPIGQHEVLVFCFDNHA